MSKMFKRLTTTGIAMAVVLGSFMPSGAAMLPVQSQASVAVEGGNNIVEVKHRGYRRGYYHGHRGYRHKRPGYRYYDGFWFPLAAFGAGAIIGGAIAQPAPPPRAGAINPRHYRWCADRYRSYDARSNTYQPYNGPRRQCLSPYY